MEHSSCHWCCHDGSGRHSNIGALAPLVLCRAVEATQSWNPGLSWPDPYGLVFLLPLFSTTRGVQASVLMATQECRDSSIRSWVLNCLLGNFVNERKETGRKCFPFFPPIGHSKAQWLCLTHPEMSFKAGQWLCSCEVTQPAREWRAWTLLFDCFFYFSYFTFFFSQSSCPRTSPPSKELSLKVYIHKEYMSLEPTPAKTSQVGHRVMNSADTAATLL